MKLQLLPYEKSDAATVVSWASTATEIFRWAGMTEPPTLSDFDRWHADADIHPMVGYVKGKQLAYGELWVDPVQREIELGRIIVHPAHRSPSPSGTRNRAVVCSVARRPDTKLPIQQHSGSSYTGQRKCNTMLSISWFRFDVR